MALKSKNRSVFVFSVIIAVMVGMVIYLLFFNVGLKFTKDQADGKTAVYIKNDSIHAIRDINIMVDMDGKRNQWTFIKLLKPGEKVKLKLPNATLVKFFALAPFHSTVSTEISLSATRDIQIKFNTSHPKPVLEGVPFEFKLNLCNQGSTIPNVIVSENHAISDFEEGGKKEIKTLPGGECTEFVYNLTPLRKGETLIFFNIKAVDFTEDFEQNIEVE